MVLNRTIIFLILACATVFAVSCSFNGKGGQAENKNKKLSIAVSVNPLALIMREIAGERAEVQVIVPPAANPHVFEPSPGQLMALSNSDLFIFAGLGFEFWKDKFLNVLQKKKSIELSEYVDVIDSSCEEEHCPHHKHGNPHYWTSPKEVVRLVNPIKLLLIDLDPAGKDYYEARSAAFLKELSLLDSECQQTILGLKNKNFVSQHSAWPYFARDYGLNQVGVIESSPGKEPTPACLKKIIDKVKSGGASFILADMQFSAKAAGILAEESGVRVIMLDPIGTPNQSYADFIRKNLEAIKKAGN